MLEGLSKTELTVLTALTIKSQPEALAFSFEAGWYYPPLTKLNLGREEVEKTLKSLINKGLIVTEPVTKSILCPSCRSFKVLTFYSCPFCNSKNVEKDALLEHFSCGTLNRRGYFKSNGKLICPTCKRELRALGVDYTIAGVWFKCLACNKTFEAPSISHRCVACGFDFDYRNSIYEDVNKHTITSKGVEVAKRVSFAYAVEKAAEKTGFTSEFNGTIKGTSGVEHRFDFILRKGEHVIAVELLFNDVSPLLVSVLASLYDTSSVTHIIAMIPETPAEAKNMINRYNAIIVNASTPDELSLAIENILSKYS
ncbi:MAG: hypothetical protein QXP83_07500 [Candidatus Nezhaarchaeales archaeon]